MHHCRRRKRWEAEKIKKLLWNLNRLRILNRRFLRRPSFLLLLLLPPLLAWGLAASAGGEAGVVTVALYAGGDPLAAELGQRLSEDPGVLRFVSCPTADQARDLVGRGRTDAAWLFSEDFSRELERYAAGKRTAAVTVVEREDNVLLMLSREKLYAALFPSAVRAAERQLLEELGDGGDAPPAGTPRHREFIRFSYLDGGESGEAEDSYLLSPLRGLLGLLLALGGLTAAVLLAQDREAGAQAWLRSGLRPWFSALCLLLPMADLALSVYMALWLGGLLTAPLYELALLALLVFAGAGFAGVTERLFRSPQRICFAALLLSLLMLALCPIFLRVGRLSLPGRLFPLWYYLTAVHDPAQAAALALYGLTLWLLLLLPPLFRQKIRRPAV